ncbi:MAG: glycosyltransferase family 4 protein [Pseudomonadota bacterium]
MTDASPRLPEGPIAYLTGQYPRATDTFVQREVFGLRDLGVEVLTCSIRRTGPAHHVGPEQEAEARSTFCVLAAAADPITSLRAHGCALFGAPKRYLSAFILAVRTRQAGLKGFLLQMAYFAEAVVLAHYLAQKGVRHLHNHIAQASCTVAMLMSAVSGIPYSFTLHGPYVFFETERWRLDEKIARAAFVACISHFCRSQGMLFSEPVHWPRMHIVHCGIDPDLYDCPGSKALGKRLLFVGRLAAAKGLPVLLKAFSQVHLHHPDATLTLVGDGHDRAAIEAQSRELGLETAVIFTGYLSQADVAEKLAEADIFVLPSFAEGLPVVLMEALASRMPVVATRIAGVGELIEDGISGVLVPPGDADTLAEQIKTLLAAPETWAQMGVAGRERVVADFDIRSECRHLASLMAVYQACADTKAHSS